MRALFFDADGVLYTHGDRQAHLRAFLAGQGLALPPWERLRPAIAATVKQAVIGAIARDALYDAILTACGLSDAALVAQGRAALVADDAHIIIRNGVPQTLRTLAARGVKLGVITNSASGAAEKLAWLRARGVEVRWDSFVSSCEVHLRKPDPAIYRLALARCGVEAHDAVFVGHSASELRGARDAGLATIAIDPDAGAQADVTLGTFVELLELSFLRKG